MASDRAGWLQLPQSYSSQPLKICVTNLNDKQSPTPHFTEKIFYES